MERKRSDVRFGDEELNVLVARSVVKISPVGIVGAI